MFPQIHDLKTGGFYRFRKKKILDFRSKMKRFCLNFKVPPKIFLKASLLILCFVKLCFFSFSSSFFLLCPLPFSLAPHTFPHPLCPSLFPFSLPTFLFTFAFPYFSLFYFPFPIIFLLLPFSSFFPPKPSENSKSKQKNIHPCGCLMLYQHNFVLQAVRIST